MRYTWRRAILARLGTRKRWRFFVAGYALSPIDLMPDFIPVLGYLDEAILLPIGIWAVVKLIPADYGI